MKNNSEINNRKSRFDRQFPVMFDQQTLDRLRSISEENAFSMGAFIRQSVIRNLKAYEKLS